MAPTSASAFLHCIEGGDFPAHNKTSANVGFSVRFGFPTATTIDGQTGKVDDGASCPFADHGWIEALCVEFDVLFGKVGVDSGGCSAETGSGNSPVEFGKTRMLPTGKVTPISALYLTHERSKPGPEVAEVAGYLPKAPAAISRL